MSVTDGGAVPRRDQLAPIPAREKSSPGISGVSLPEAGFKLPVGSVARRVKCAVNPPQPVKQLGRKRPAVFHRGGH